MLSLLSLIDHIIELYTWCLIIVVAMSWLTAFNVINTQNKFVFQIYDFLYRITEPALRPIRRFIPNFGGIDISPVVLILLLVFVRNLIREYHPDRAAHEGEAATEVAHLKFLEIQQAYKELESVRGI